MPTGVAPLDATPFSFERRDYLFAFRNGIAVFGIIVVGSTPFQRSALVTSFTKVTRFCTAEMAVYWPNTFSS